MKNKVENSSGIYIIHNTISGKFYIGSAVKLNKRRVEHTNRLKRGIHSNKHLQNSYWKHSMECFQFYILERTTNLIEREQYYIDNLNPEYNICRVAGNRAGTKASQESRERMSKAHLGVKFSAEHMESIRRAAALRRGISRPPCNMKKVIQLSLTGDFIKKWDSMIEAAKELNVCPTNITKCCRGKQKTTKGFKWKYSDVK